MIISNKCDELQNSQRLQQKFRITHKKLPILSKNLSQ